MTTFDRPTSFLLPACLGALSDELTRLVVTGQIDASPNLVGTRESCPLENPGHSEPRESPRYSIRVPERPGEVICARSGNRFTAIGPTAYVDDQPITDLAMLDGSRELGMLLALAAVTRAFGGVPLTAPAVSREALVQLAAFARIYESFAARSGPPRPFDLPGQ